MNDISEKEAIRQAIREALPAIEPDYGDPQGKIRSTYVPPSHVKALDPENPVVEGIRGAGKSFWTTALNSEEHRRFVAEAYPDTRMRDNTKVSLGFGTQQNQNFPSKDVLRQLAKEYEPRQIWRAVIASQLEFQGSFPLTGKWKEKVSWVVEDPEDYDESVSGVDNELGKAKRLHIILFDALDRLADDWTTIRPLARGLFQVALEFQSYRSIRLKLFVRPDMLEDSGILNFPDASKLQARKVSLSWRKADLYALFYQCLANNQAHGSVFRNLVKGIIRNEDWSQMAASKVWVLPTSLRLDETIQRQVFDMIAGKNMASGDSGYKRGKPYTWLPNHLVDGRDQVSPRSFCVALRKAAEHESTALQSWPHALHFKGIHEGVQEASRIRVNEIKEDYPWVSKVMDPLKGQSVPCAQDAFSEVWKFQETINNLSQEDEPKLPPQHLDKGAEGLLEDLEGLGIIQRQSGDRIQMPDVYRIAFRLGRRGGVRPLK